MFTQVYYHKTRVIYDYHLAEALKCMLPGQCFPTPDNLVDYLKWDDWRVLGLLANDEGGEHGKRLADRNHYCVVHYTPETPTKEDLERFEAVKSALKDFEPVERSSERNWYKQKKIAEEIMVKSNNAGIGIRPLSVCSSIAKALQPINQKLLYVRPEDEIKARTKIKSIGENT